MRTVFYILLIALALGGGAAPALAQSSGANPASTEPAATSTDTLSDGTVQSTSTEELSPEEKFTRAKEGLTKALTLAQEKVAALRNDLEGRTFKEGSIEAALKAQFLEELGEYESFYSEQLGAVEGLQTLEEVQALATEVKTYRDAVYTPGVEKIVQFTLVFYAEDVIRTANERLAGILSDIDELTKAGLIEEGTFADTRVEIESLLAEASRLKDEAHALVVPQEPLPEDVANPRQLLQASLTNVKTAYTKFLDISNAVRETLGLQ